MWVGIARKGTFVLLFSIRPYLKFFTKTLGFTCNSYIKGRSNFLFSSKQPLCGPCDCDKSLKTDKSTDVFGKEPSCPFRNIYFVQQSALVIPFQCKLNNSSKNLFNFLCFRVNWKCLKKIKIFLTCKTRLFSTFITFI